LIHFYKRDILVEYEKYFIVIFLRFDPLNR